MNYVAANLPEDLNFWIDVDRRIFRTDRPLWTSDTGGTQIPTEVAARLEDALQSRSAVPLSSELLFDPTAPPEWLPGISNDGVDGEQFINIKADVQSIARVMCMKDVSPPLSIALFGNWGSGKSFFMKQLQKEVEGIKDRAPADARTGQFYRHVIQIEFNAWHYVEANLWASLVFHLFENLRAPGRNALANAEAKHNALLDHLGLVGQVKLRAERALEEARAHESVAQQTLIIKQNEAQSKQLVLQRISSTDILKRTIVSRSVISKLKEAGEILGLSEALGSAKEVTRSLRETNQFANKTSAFVRAFWNAPGLNQRLAFVSLAVASPLLTTLGMSLIARVAKMPEWSEVQKVLASIAALGLAALQPIMKSKGDAEKALAKLKGANDEFNDLIHEQERTLERERMNAEAEHTQAAHAVAVAARAVEEADRQVQQARKALAEASPIRLLNSFIEERSASDDYRKSLGTLALVRRDFEKLSDLMGDARDYRLQLKVPTEEELKLHESLPEIDRIILYIDDLDRCPPKQVVEVLQAIHLLLAFELFVVVVGVDPRWISLSLKEHYPELLGMDGPAPEGVREDATTDRARPIDYLEKIFQIPFWIKPIGAPETHAMVQGLLAPNRRPSAPEPQPAPEARSAGDGPGIGLRDAPPPSVAKSDDRHTPSAPSPAPVPSKPAAREPEAELAGTELSEAEKAFLTSLGPSVGTTPRAIKRFLNIYRLLRARVSRKRIKEFEGEAGAPREFEAVMHLLAMFSTAPQLAQVFVRELEQCKAEEESRLPSDRLDVRLRTPLAHTLDKLKSGNHKPESESRLVGVLAEYPRKFGHGREPSIDAYCRWYPVVSRYSFTGESSRQSPRHATLDPQ